MKRNLVPLLAVAFAVAVASTGIFYGLFVGKLKGAPPQTVITAARNLPAGTQITEADLGKLDWAGTTIPAGMYTSADKVLGKTVLQPVDAGEPVLSSRLVSKTSGGPGVPEGMRAVSVHIADSSGILALLKPGYKVDVQVFGPRPTTQGVEGAARTIFQNIEVLSVSPTPEPSSQGNFSAPVITVIANPVEADALGVADSFSRIRLALRNPVDGAKTSKGTLPVSALLRGGAFNYEAPTAVEAAAAPKPVAVPVAPVAAPASRPLPTPTAAVAAPVKTQVGLNVQLFSASPEAIGKLKRYGVTGRADTLDAAQVQQPADLEKVLAQLRADKSLDVLSLSRINAALSRTAAVELKGEKAGAVRLQFYPFVANGQLRVKVQPEVTTAEGASPGTRKIETEMDISSGRSFLISGLKDSTNSTTNGRQLLVLVTPN